MQLASGFAFLILTRALLTEEEECSILTTVVGAGMKEKFSIGLYALSIPLAYANTWLAFTAFIIVALMRLVPDRRFSKVVPSNVDQSAQIW